MRKPTAKQFAKVHPELSKHHVDIVKHSNGVTVYVNITEDLTFDEKGRVLTALEKSYILDEALQLAKQYGKDTNHVHTYQVAMPGELTGCTTSFQIGGDKPTLHKHTVAA